MADDDEKIKSPVVDDVGSVKAENEDAEKTGDASRGVTSDDYKIMKGIVDYLTDYKDANGHETSGLFQRLLNKRLIPDYFEVIKQPTAFSTIRGKILRKQYADYKEFVRDWALISHNAQVYNRPSAPVYTDAMALRELVKLELAKLVDKNIITPEVAVFPELGEIPEVEDSPPPGPEEEAEEDEEDEEEDEDDEDTDEDRPRAGRRKKSRPSGPRRDDSRIDDKEDVDPHKVRGRPPKVLTPMEARINYVLKGLRKFKNTGGDLKILPFERLPDKSVMPEYYHEIKTPIAMDLIKRKAKRKKYQSVDAVMRDVELMFENAKSYNLDDSQVYRDAVDLQREARLLAEQEKKRPDSDFVDEDGKLPLSEVLYKGEIWKVGDWVHLQNPNDLTKPIVAQIYRTWQDTEGQKWINACWYYRPEQTVHRYEKHFFENEVVKTGRYQDHQVDEIVDRCFVMFFTRFFKGRPRGFPSDKEVYVCEARYNEEKFKLNKIKTWASCVPDEVREVDYEMDLFDVPRPMKKVPSPIKHLLREDAKEEDPLPKPTWGAANAPPIVGAVHKKPREANESPPPEPTPEPQASQPPDAARRSATHDRSTPYDSKGAGAASATNAIRPPTNVSHHQPTGSYSQQFGSSRPSASPASPAPPLTHHNSYNSQTGSHHPSTSQAPQATPHQMTSYGSYATTTAQPAATPTHSYAASTVPPPAPPQYNPPPILPPAHPSTRPSVSHSSSSLNASNAYKPPRPVEVYHLPDAANAGIPMDIRSQFHCDEFDRVLFFTAPPLDVSDVPSTAKNLGHSVKYLAKVARDEAARRTSAKEGQPMDKDKPETLTNAEPQIVHPGTLEDMKTKALVVLGEHLTRGTENVYKELYGSDWEGALKAEQARLADLQRESLKKRDLMQRHEVEDAESKRVRLF